MIFRKKFLATSIVFCTIFCICLSMHFFYPTSYYDNIYFDYNATLASHALLYKERSSESDYKKTFSNMNLSQHPGVPYYLISGISRICMPDAQNDTKENIIYYFNNIDTHWMYQWIATALIASFSAILLLLYCTNVNSFISFILFFLPVAAFHSQLCSSYLFALANETFSMPIVLLFFLASKYLFERPAHRMSITFMLGIVAGVAYLIKMPYIVLFCTGCAAVFLSTAAWKHINRWIVQTFVYLAGFILVCCTFLACFGYDITYNLFQFHMATLFHTGLYGGGNTGLIEATAVLSHMKKLGLLLGTMLPVLLSFAWCVYTLYKTKAYKDINVYQVVLLSVCFFGFILTVLKHYGNHYAFPLFCIMTLLCYEIIHPLLHDKKSVLKKRAAYILLGSIILSALAGYISFGNRMNKVVQNRTQITSLLENIEQLPKKNSEVVYYLWGAHKLPIFSVSHALGITYLPENIKYEAFRALYPSLYNQTAITIKKYDFENIKIRYIVMQAEEWEVAHEGKDLSSSEKPHPRFILEKNDQLILQKGGIVIIEKVPPIDM